MPTRPRLTSDSDASESSWDWSGGWQPDTPNAGNKAGEWEWRRALGIVCLQVAPPPGRGGGAPPRAPAVPTAGPRDLLRISDRRAARAATFRSGPPQVLDVPTISATRTRRGAGTVSTPS